MNIQTITCSGPNEKVKTTDILQLLIEYPMAEIGIQSYRMKAEYGTHRYYWIRHLVNEAKKIPEDLHAALHVNLDWCHIFCNGIIPLEMNEFLHLKHNKVPFFRRVQLNFALLNGKNIADVADPKKVANSIKSFPEQTFILSYNERTSALIQRIADLNVSFDVLYDKSFGAGINPGEWNPPAFSDRLQGYAGGLGPDNVAENLDQINKVVPDKTTVFIDAQGKLENEAGTFCCDKAKQYIKNVLEWEKGTSNTISR